MRRSSIHRALPCIVAAVLLLSSAPTRAEEDKLTTPAPRQGYYIALNFGGFSPLDRDSDEGWLGPAFGYALSLRLGEQLVRWCDLGISFNYGYASNDDYIFRTGGVRLEGQFYPRDKLFTRLAIGFDFTDVTRQAGRGLEKISGRAGDYYGLTVGRHFLLGTRDTGSGGFSMAPYLHAGVGPGSDYLSIQFLIGIEGAFWTGLPGNQLAAPL